MMFLFYGLIGVGVILLMADRNGLLIASSDHVRWLRLIGLGAATIVGVGPVVWLVTSDMTWWYPPIVIATSRLPQPSWPARSGSPERVR
jgi:hypothetical protein